SARSVAAMVGMYVLVGAMGFAATACMSKSTEKGAPDAKSSSGVARESEPRPSPHSQPTDDGSIKVVKKGVSRTLTRDDSSRMTSYGVVVENTSDMVATGVKIRIRVLGPQGTLIKDRDDPKSSYTKSREIYYVQPGEKQGVGGAIFHTEGAASRLDVDIRVGAWWSPESPPEVMPKVEFRDITIKRELNGDAEFSLTADVAKGDGSVFCIQVVILNANDEVTGGVTLDGKALHLGENEVTIREYKRVPPKIQGEHYEAYASIACS
ncbi:MAG: hypothetical protein ACRD1T_09645, partial [Acidimicrobiia bacterium]